MTTANNGRSNGTHEATGRILMVQEERFRLMTDAGDTLLLTVPTFARFGPADLKRWRAQNAHVRVTYAGAPNLVSGVARSIKEM